MKILFVETMTKGHHTQYLKCLCSNNNYECVIITPEENLSINTKQYVYNIDLNKKKYYQYIRFINYIKEVAKKFNPDVIHFLDGDTIMRYFNLSFLGLSNYNIVITYHHFFCSFLRKISYKLMCSGGRVSVVHTKNIKEKLNNYNIKRVNHIEYPSFVKEEKCVKKNSNVLNIGAIGGTRYEKGIDILLKALKIVRGDFHLIIAGPENDIKREDIEGLIESFKEKVTIDLRFVSDYELNNYLNNIDLIVLPYRKSFNGASGPLTEGVAKGKMIIGPNHGSLNEIIINKHIGKVFKSEDPIDLARVIDDVINNEFKYDDTANSYKKYLSPNRFKNDYFRLYEEILNLR